MRSTSIYKKPTVHWVLFVLRVGDWTGNKTDIPHHLEAQHVPGRSSNKQTGMRFIRTNSRPGGGEAGEWGRPFYREWLARETLGEEHFSSSLQRDCWCRSPVAGTSWAVKDQQQRNPLFWRKVGKREDDRREGWTGNDALICLSDFIR